MDTQTDDYATEEPLCKSIGTQTEVVFPARVANKYVQTCVNVSILSLSFLFIGGGEAEV